MSQQLNSYDHHAAIYLLLLERLRTRSASQESNVCLSNTQLNNVSIAVAKHPSLEQQRRRPSSIAEQAMRKLGIGTSSYVRTDSPPARQHAPSLHTNNERPLEPIPSMITLRDTNIREQAASPSAALHQMRGENCGNYFRGSAAYMGLARDRLERDCNSPYGQYGSLVGGRENSCMLSRDSCVTPMGAHRTPSNRLLSSGIDQRIMKQSTEDCRRLLQQVNCMFDLHYSNRETFIKFFICFFLLS